MLRYFHFHSPKQKKSSSREREEDLTFSDGLPEKSPAGKTTSDLT